jgi:photosystem II stability/assembly factor-like uncharacterized protein
MFRLAFFVLFLFAALSSSSAQWEVEDSHTTADLRGIHAVGNGVAWASGTNGTALRTTDDGKDWQLCATPSNAEHLDFRGIQAFGANTAIVMSSGKGPLSRLYKTTDGCQTWKLLFINPDPDGFWDTLLFRYRDVGTLLGDPVGGEFYLSLTFDGGKHWFQQHNGGLKADPALQGVFAASNSILPKQQFAAVFATGGLAGASVFRTIDHVLCLDNCPEQVLEGQKDKWQTVTIPIGNKTASSGVFSLADGPQLPPPAGGLYPPPPETLVAVGGDYLKPDDANRTAAFTHDRGEHWTSATTPPHGFRSAVAYDAGSKTWITVGPNGTDISTDDGRTWRALKPGPAEPPDADQHWNAISLPFVVGPHGRIGKLNAKALAP